MNLKQLKPRKALNKAFLKLKPNRSEIEVFKTNLIQLLDRINEKESEEFHKNLIIDFLKKTYYEPNHYVNTKGRTDLVIHNGNKASSTVGVIVETKKPTNKSEMLKAIAPEDTKEQRLSKINVKAFQEMVLYYLRERITHKNLEIRYLIATSINEWFVFDANIFEKLFAHNKEFVKQFNAFEEGRLTGKTTDFFYKEIAEPFIATITQEIEFTYFDIREYEKPLRNNDKKDDNKLITLYKLLSPEHLLKLPFANDSNTLDKRFYGELLHIMGLNETKEGGKKIIERNKEGSQNFGSILENAIIELDSLDKIGRLEKPSQFGSNQQERLFNVALELSITWINRILFLKLLEAQLIKYHKGDKSYSFLSLDKIQNYDDLNSLFFKVLARRHDERVESVKTIFEKVPYLNSSLFEPTDLEHTTLFISNLRDEKHLPIYSASVLKDNKGKKRTGSLNTLEYLFEFLDAYDFTSEGSEEIQEDNKSLINASVLGLIFEKINGYKDGSFFTPSFITMYMCRETIGKAVIQKFNNASPPLLRGVGGVLRGVGGVSSGVEGVSSGVEGVSRRKIIPYNPKLKELARNLRNKSTKSEVILWLQLKGKFEGKYDFHRQKPLDNYIADFFCHELKLVIEIDGETHNWEETQKKDFEKECKLNDLGLNVLRFPDTEIFENLNQVVETIMNYANGFAKGDLSEFRYDDTPLNPLSRGDFALPDPTQHEQQKNRFNTLDDVYEEIGDDRLFTRSQANEIVNSLKICDPAVGSGHFLVSALNEIIAIKNNLRILQDREGKRLKEYHAEVVNDELIVTDEEGIIFEYNPKSKESQRVQETLFHEKQTIIENCLFGVDINPNSVKICRLRLWIELLKNAYYLPTGQAGQTPPLERGAGGVLETLPNIDINIKCGNSLVSRFAIDADLGQALKKSKWTIDSYRVAVSIYRNAKSKEQKREMERLIADIKSDFRSEIASNDPKLKRLNKVKGELYIVTNQTSLFEKSKKEKQEFNKKVGKFADEIKKLDADIEEIKNNQIYENAFEWRFEFPEVLNDKGEFVGFDVVIGNPPYGVKADKAELNYNKSFYTTNDDIYTRFFEKSIEIIKTNSILNFITPIFWLNGDNYIDTRRMVSNKSTLELAIILPYNVFADAYVDTGIFQFTKGVTNNHASVYEYDIRDNINIETLLNTVHCKLYTTDWKSNDDLSIVINPFWRNLKTKIYSNKTIGEISDSFRGILSDKVSFSKQKINENYLPVFTSSFNRFEQPFEEYDFVDYQTIKEGPKDYSLFQGEKILVRRIVNRQLRIMATITNSFVSFKKDIYIFHLKDSNLIETITAIINSKLISFILTKGSASARKDDFTQITLSNIRNIGIPFINENSVNSITGLVKNILEIKKQSYQVDTTNLESQIDQLVYQLYDLSPEEIEIIESSVK